MPGHARLWILAAACCGLARISLAEATLADCRHIAGDRERLACYDALADRADAGSPTPTAADLFGHDAVRSAAMARAAAGIGDTEAITATVTQARRDAYGKLVMVLGNGQTWEQIDTAPLPVKAGAEVRIRRAALDSYLLSLAAGGQGIRVRRRP